MSLWGYSRLPRPAASSLFPARSLHRCSSCSQPPPGSSGVPPKFWGPHTISMQRVVGHSCLMDTSPYSVQAAAPHPRRLAPRAPPRSQHPKLSPMALPHLPALSTADKRGARLPRRGRGGSTWLWVEVPASMLGGQGGDEAQRAPAPSPRGLQPPPCPAASPQWTPPPPSRPPPAGASRAPSSRPATPQPIAAHHPSLAANPTRRQVEKRSVVSPPASQSAAGSPPRAGSGEPRGIGGRGEAGGASANGEGGCGAGCHGNGALASLPLVAMGEGVAGQDGAGAGGAGRAGARQAAAGGRRRCWGGRPGCRRRYPAGSRASRRACGAETVTPKYPPK